MILIVCVVHVAVMLMRISDGILKLISLTVLPLVSLISSSGLSIHIFARTHMSHIFYKVTFLFL